MSDNKGDSRRAAAGSAGLAPFAAGVGALTQSVFWPALFVLLWSTGFIGAKLGLPHADALSFLAVRFWITAALLGAWLLVVSAPLPSREFWPALALVGVLNHGVYLGGVFLAIGMGLNAGVAALIAGLSPIFTGLIASATGMERLTPKRWLGMALGFGGVALAVAPRIEPGAFGGTGAASLTPPLLVLGAALALSAAAILQRGRLGRAPLAGGGFVQACAAAVLHSLALGIALSLGWEARFSLHPELIFAIAWLVLVLSIGAITLLFVLLRRGEASSVSSLFFLTPASAAVIAWAMFGETLSALQILGFAIAAVGVALASAAPAPAAVSSGASSAAR